MVVDRRAGSAGGYDFSTARQSRAGPDQIPPPPPFAHRGMYQGAPGMYPGMPGMYPPPPGMYPMPGMYPPMYPAMMPMQNSQPEPKASKMPATGFIIGMMAMLPSLGMFIVMLLMVLDIGVRMGWTTDECCFSMVGIWLLAVVLSTLATIFGSIAFWGVKTKVYSPTWMAPAGFVMAIVSASLSLGTIIMFFVRVAVSM